MLAGLLHPTAEKIGMLAPLIIRNCQDFIKPNGLTDKDQNIGWPPIHF
ncbi:MAG: hypothetical protein M1354_03000 [Candidatus Marsarchaeota archaeon]|jgi:hypothetical protein|nr:hypothetical protein [Candidatus Marsarchaeota archaeon]